MIPNRIKYYYRPRSVDEAAALKAEHPEAVYLAGGTQINRAPLERAMPSAVIDLRDALESAVRADGDELIIGAFTTLQAVADAEPVPRALRDAAGFIPTRSIRNQAAIGGNIGARRPDSYVIPALIALAAELCTTGGRMTVHEYISGGRQDLILDIRIPSKTHACVAVKESRSHLALPVVSAAVSLAGGAGRVAASCIAVGCVAANVIRLTAVEKDLASGALTDRGKLEAAIQKAVNPSSDILGSAAYKRYINGVIIADAVMRCREALS